MKVKATSEKNLVDAASSLKIFKSLCMALEAADLIDMLKNQGPFTVFAPSDQAFDRLELGAMEDLFKSQHRELLADILKHHIVSGSHSLAEIGESEKLTALNGHELWLKSEAGQQFVCEAKIVQPDVWCSNGVIHVIDTLIRSE